jgi:heme/copper-type cytochrome/quinol oxidase subunit 4
MFIFFSNYFGVSFQDLTTNLVIAANITYRGMVTFSRGGMITGLLMIVLLLSFLYFKSNYKGKVKLNYIFSVIVVAMVVIGGYVLPNWRLL